MSKEKQEVRRKFRDAVFRRDKYRCMLCGLRSSPENAELELDAHHIWPREDMPNGGYVKENGVTLCDPSKRGGPLESGCHYKAEMALACFYPHRIEGNFHEGADPDTLYQKIGSSLEKARKAASRLH